MKSNLELSYITLPRDTDEKYFMYNVQNWGISNYPVPVFPKFVPHRFLKKDGRQIKMELSPSYTEQYWFQRKFYV